MAGKELKYKVTVDGDDAEKGIKKVKKGLKDVEDQSKKTSASTKELTGQLDKVTGGAASKFSALKASLKGVTTGFKSMRVAIISTGIGALIIGILAVTAAFKGSEEGQNKWNKIMAVVGALTGNLVDLLADLGELLIKVFTEPIAVFKDFKAKVKEYITDQIAIVTEGLGLLGSAFKKAFSGDFSGALDDASKGLKKLYIDANPVAQAINGIAKATKDFTKEQIREGKAAAYVADMRAKADKIERDLIVERSKLESKIALLRLKSRQEDQFSAEVRKQALLDAQVLEDSLLDKETKYLELRRDAQIQENTFSRSNKENLTKEAEAIAAVNRQVASRANVARQVQREVNTISKQISAAAKAEADETKRLSDEEQKRAEEALKTKQESLQAIKDEFKTMVEDSEAETEVEKIELEYERHLAKLEALQIGLDAENEIYKAAEEEKAKILGYYTGKIKKQEEKDLKEAADFKEKQYKDTYSKLQNILSVGGGAMEKISKGLAIADIVRTSYKSISATISSTGEANAAAVAASPLTVGQPWVAANTIKAGIDIASTLASAKKSVSAIAGNSKSIGSKPSMSRGSGAGVSAQASSYTPEKSVAQLIAESNKDIATNGQKPMRAYVVSGDVTTAQSMERNIVDGASI